MDVWMAYWGFEFDVGREVGIAVQDIDFKEPFTAFPESAPRQGGALFLFGGGTFIWGSGDALEVSSPLVDVVFCDRGEVFYGWVGVFCFAGVFFDEASCGRGTHQSKHGECSGIKSVHAGEVYRSADLTGRATPFRRTI